MSEGPISQWRKGTRPAPVSVTPRAEQLHAPGREKGRAYCGRRNVKLAAKWDDVTCPDCGAAYRADEEAA